VFGQKKIVNKLGFDNFEKTSELASSDALNTQQYAANTYTILLIAIKTIANNRFGLNGRIFFHFIKFAFQIIPVSVPAPQIQSRRCPVLQHRPVLIRSALSLTVYCSGYL
jgi:hypothetical protein